MISIIENELDSQFGKYTREAFDEVLIFYEWFALNSIHNDNAGLAFIAIDKSKNRSLKKSFPSIKSNNDVFDKELYDFDPHLNDNESFVMVEEINSSSNILYKMGSSLNLKGLEVDLQTNDFNQLFMYKMANDSHYWHLAKYDSTIFNETTPNLKILAKVYLNMLKNSKVSRFESNELSKILYSTIIKEEKSIANSKTKLIIAPDPIISNIPLETLIDQNGKYLVETLDISYIQSYSVLKLLRERNYTNTESKLLAFGGINYSNNDFTKIKDDEIELLINLRSNNNEYSTNDIFGSLGYDNWKPLPGTLEEIKSIKRELPQAEIFSGKDANESLVKSLSSSGKLKTYKMIHFATHAVVMPDLPGLSSIVLSSTKNGSEDGYLTVNEISQLELNADFVNLSACETGLGKVYAGDGVIGLTQAFMEAGANGVCVSLWPVEDQSTAIFMTSVYAKIADGFSYSFAITDTKRDFISGKYGEEYKKPYYWAPFVYYGK
jgi:CHAT domain-containing protein